MALTEPVDETLRGRVIAMLVTDAALPALELVARRYPRLARGPDGVVRVLFDAEGIGADLVFKSGTLRVCRSNGLKADVEINVKSAEALRSLLKGQIELPFRITRGAWRADLLGRLAGCFMMLGLSAVPMLRLPVSGSDAFTTRVLVETVLRAAAVIGSADPGVFDVIECEEGETFVVRIAGAGPCGTLSFSGKGVVFKRGAGAGGATATLVLDSPALLNEIAIKKADPLEAYSDGRIDFEGESALLVMMGYLLVRCMDYLDFHPWLD